MINVTKTALPSRKKLDKYIDGIYKRGWVTNNGPLVQELECRLSEYLGVKNLVLVANGTVALEIAYRTLGCSGFAVTTPFSFVATTSSLVTNGFKPIFCDIDAESFNLDANHLNEVITPNTQLIVATHVFGNACDIGEIERISSQTGVKVVYDAAHCFGVNYRGGSILENGDISTLSFHATKVFNTIEGGAVVIRDDDLVQKARYLINFGIENAESIPELGTNAKMNEFEAAVGLCLLDDIDQLIDQRKEVYETYKSALNGMVDFQRDNPDCSKNYGYFPVVFESESELLEVKLALENQGIYPRRYFYPSLDTLNYIEPRQVCVNSRDVASRVLCLPISHEFDKSDQDRIIEIVKSALRIRSS